MLFFAFRQNVFSPAGQNNVNKLHFILSICLEEGWRLRTNKTWGHTQLYECAIAFSDQYHLTTSQYQFCLILLRFFSLRWTRMSYIKRCKKIPQGCNACAVILQSIWNRSQVWQMAAQLQFEGGMVCSALKHAFTILWLHGHNLETYQLKKIGKRTNQSQCIL